MKQLAKSILVSSLLIVSANAGKDVVPAVSEPVAVPTPYVPLGLYLGAGLNYTHGKCQCAGLTCSDGTSCGNVHKNDVYGFNLKAGYMFNDYLGVEAKYIYAPWKGFDIKHYGLYLKPTYPVTDKLDIYALLGYGKTECQISSENYKHFGWGVGAEYIFGKKIENKKKGFGVYVEYLRPLKKTGNKKITIDMVNTGVSYSF